MSASDDATPCAQSIPMLRCYVKLCNDEALTKSCNSQIYILYIPHRGILQPTNLAAEGVDLLVELGEIVAVGDEVVGNGDGAALLDILNF